MAAPATTSSQLRTVEAIRYVTPLREGGSLPGLVEADDDGMYVLKFRGAGQGTKALAAEVVAGALARALGLPVPEIVLVGVDPTLGRAEPDVEIQELIAASGGTNFGIDSCPARWATWPQHRRRSMPRWPPTSSGSMPWSPTSTARRAIRICWSGTGGCG